MAGGESPAPTVSGEGESPTLQVVLDAIWLSGGAIEDGIRTANHYRGSLFRDGSFSELRVTLSGEVCTSVAFRGGKEGFLSDIAERVSRFSGPQVLVFGSGASPSVQSTRIATDLGLPRPRQLH